MTDAPPTAPTPWRNDVGVLSPLGDNAELIGKTVASVWLRIDRSAIALVFTDGTQHSMMAEGDCCAHAWIEAVDNLGFKGRFLGCGDAPDRQDSSGDHPDHDVLDINFYDFRTESGRLLVELRTSHNGYYGGRLVPDGYEVNDQEWKQIE